MKQIALVTVFFFVAFAPLCADPLFVNSADVYPGQNRYASAEVEAKTHRLVQRGYVLWNEERQVPTLQYDGGHSALGDDWSLPVVKGPFGYVLIDGHHTYLAAMHLGSTTVFVDEIADWSELKEEEFWDALESSGWAYLITIDGTRKIPPRDFSHLEDDPNRYLASLTARRIGEEFNPGGSRGAEYPVWIKVGSDQPFIELRIADAFWAAGLVYDYSMGRNPSEEVIEMARQILLEAAIDNLPVVPRRIHYSELNKPYCQPLNLQGYKDELN